MVSFTIIGTGSMGTAIGELIAAGGSQVDHVSHAELGNAPLAGDIVVLAVPYPALEQILAAYPGGFDGKTVIDITNPLNFETFDSLVVPAASSAAAELQSQLPDSTVLKAFNTNFAATLATAQTGGLPTTVLIAGDDTDAKSVVEAAIVAGGITAVDAGSLSRARELEALGFLQLTLAASEKIGWGAGFALAR